MSSSNNYFNNDLHHPNTSSNATTTATMISSSLSSARQKSGLRRHPSKNKLSIQEEIDNYAQQLIEYTAHAHQQQEQSGSNTIDDSLGSYITNCLRTSLSEMNISTVIDGTLHPQQIIDVATIPDYESFCELIQEHCQLAIVNSFGDDDHNNHHSNDYGYHTNPIAIHVLQKILNVLTTQHIPADDFIIFQNTQQKQLHGDHNTNEDDDHDANINNNSLLPESLWQDVLAETVSSKNGDSDDANYDISTTPKSSSVSISTPHTGDIIQQQKDKDDITNIVSSELDTASENQISINQQGEQQEHEEAFQQQQLYDEQELHQYEHQDVDEYIRSNVVGMLLQWYVAQDLCYDAAYAATCMANNNVILAQYIIASAFTQIPICKHLLNDGKCYRADCTFNHNIDQHTCVFWMKSRGCSKRDSAIDPCRFLHGFSPKLLENIPEQIQIQAAAANHSHNSTITPYRNVRDFYATSVPTNSISDTGNNHPSNTDTTSNVKSFANIASKGYSTKKSFTQLHQDQVPITKSNSIATTATAIQQVLQQLPTMLIPQNLWQAHENRDASAFYISDPLERYYTVSATTPSTATSSKNSHNSNNIIDLHYQSIKTFPVVLDTILPEKLTLLTPPSDSSIHGSSLNTNGIWIVTGTGHHVNTQRTHQKGGSTLENAVLEYLISNYVLSPTNDNSTGIVTASSPNKYRIYKGRDRNGKGGAIFIQRKY
jgi:hypothetical protein